MLGLRNCFLILIAILGVHAAQAEELGIVDVRRHITLADDDIVYKDFYLNGGEAEGLKKNLVVTAFRKIQVRDASGSQGYGEIQVPVGQLRVIAVYGKVSVAREYKLLSRDELPMLEQTGLMSGDRIDLKGAFVDTAKPKYVKKSIAENAPSAATLVAAVVTTAAAPATPGPALTSAASKATTASGSTANSSPTTTKGPAPASVDTAVKASPAKAVASSGSSSNTAAAAATSAKTSEAVK
jgi:hypothetical protein